MQHQLIRCLALGLGVVASCLAHAAQARGPSYLFHGRFAPTDRLPTSESTPISPNELMGREFTIAVSWPASAADYSPDWQTGAGFWGSYTSESIFIEIDVPGFDFSIPPTIASWETFNDAVLDYYQGVPQSWGDELRLNSRTDWSHTLDIETTFGGQTQIETLNWVANYLLTMRAVDGSGSHFVDDSLQTNFDLASFGSVLFEFQQIVPVAGSDPRPIVYQRWLGIVDSVVAVPEPSCGAVTSVALICGIFCRRLSRRCSGCVDFQER